MPLHSTRDAELSVGDYGIGPAEESSLRLRAAPQALVDRFAARLVQAVKRCRECGFELVLAGKPIRRLHLYQRNRTVVIIQPVLARVIKYPPRRAEISPGFLVVPVQS